MPSVFSHLTIYSLMRRGFIEHLFGQGTELRVSLPRQVDKKSRIPEEKKGVWVSRSGDRGLEFSRRRKRQTSFFPPTFLSLSHIKLFFFFLLPLKLIVIQQTTQFKLCTKNCNNKVSCLRIVSPS